MIKNFILSFSIFICTSVLFAQKISNETIKDQIDSYKKDVRGPYKDIRWFCTDGSVRQPKDPCPDNIGPGIQHARYKDAIVELGNKNHIFLGQILAYTDKVDFWDTPNNHSRLKQYQIEKYLKTIDDGWINQKGQYYRGSIQAEDEEAWGIEFYNWLLNNNINVEQNFFLIRQSLKDIPHKGDDNLAQNIRSQSKVISDIYLPFMDLRVKIHSQPEFIDIEKVKNFKQKNASKLTPDLNKKLDELVTTMSNFYKPIDINTLTEKTKLLKNTAIGNKINEFVSLHDNKNKASEFIPQTAQLLLDVRDAIFIEKRPAARLQLFDVSLKLEEIIFQSAPQWKAESLEDLLNKICYLGMATAGSGYVEIFEFDQLNLSPPSTVDQEISLNNLTATLQNARSLVEWSSSMIKANYQDVVNEFAAFEPKSYSFIDDKIRGSITLHLGESVAELGDFIANESALTNKVMTIPNQSAFRGLNPGYAFGELVVVAGNPDDIEVSSDKIYIFQRPPADLKPISGIATVSEGNMVSHVQLLARNLGIPNAALSDDNLQNLKEFSGSKVFYAVSNKGNVIIKPESEMTAIEKALFTKKERKEEKIEVPIQNIRLDQTNILNLRSVDANDSGKLCGPKAANLGQLKKMFPDQVVEGFVIPFGIFREHMNQPMPDQSVSYWEFLNNMFAKAEEKRVQNILESEVETYQLEQLEILRAAIKKMPLKKDFVAQLENSFKTILGKEIGEVPVFLRSDTNMEDLKDFTGAGLNLTLFNVLNKNKILDGIKDVWASPYTERSFKWRQKYLLNPENVFPSILLIPSVDVDYSGVLITKGIRSGNDKDLTIAFSRGAGGAVDGQSAESYLISYNGINEFAAPSREMYYNALPLTGGTEKKVATFEKPILNIQNINDIRNLAKTIRKTMATETHSDYKGAYDVELGFKDNKLWLFQIRPFVENKKALSSDYLESITPKVDLNKNISLSKTL